MSDHHNSDDRHDSGAEPPPCVRIRVRDDGPLVVDGDVDLVDGEGRPLSPPPSTKSNIALCRCGQSAAKPFCDGAHRGAGFASCIRAPE
ncbi:MAG: CDGSH iron-sulfur domain-containing protein [Planctomycetales bacterium]|nr:CDGSH iron-sulfur domain-containing protein [Planctomycetales bacterium]